MPNSLFKWRFLSRDLSSLLRSRARPLFEVFGCLYFYLDFKNSRYCVYPKEHSTVEKKLWKTNGGEILFRVEGHVLTSKAPILLDWNNTFLGIFEAIPGTLWCFGQIKFIAKFF